MSAPGGPRPRGAPGALDPVDRRIIEELQRDGRKPFTQLAPLVGLSEAAVRQRVQRLVDAGVMQIVAVADPRVLGFTRQAMIGVKADGDAGSVADAVAAFPEVGYVVLTAGRFDMIVEAVVVDDEALLRLLNEEIRRVPGVRDAEVFVYLRVHKETYRWQVP